MIKLINSLPKSAITTVELFKIRSFFEAYPSEVLLWEQDFTGTLIAMLDGNMVIYAPRGADDELREFIGIISPASVFSSREIVSDILPPPYEAANVLRLDGFLAGEAMAGDLLKSDEIYGLLSVDGLDLPPYEHFAPDFCFRLNHGLLECFALKKKCAAIALKCGNAALINGIASHEKGFGSIALREIIKKAGKPNVFACCDPKIQEFYKKNGFSFMYEAAYWKKEK